GLAGGGSTPSSPNTFMANGHGEGRVVTAPDPLALIELSRDIRPPDYAASFARQALQFSEMAVPIIVSAIGRPPWLTAIADEPGIQQAPLADAVRLYAAEAEAACP